MTGWLVVNEFLHTNKFTELNLLMIDSAKKQGINLEVKSNAQIILELDFSGENSIKDNKNKPDFVLFWDKDIRLAKYLEFQGLPVYNSSEAIAVCDDKSLTHLYLQNAGIHMPRTIVAPMTYPNIGYPNLDFLTDIADKLGFPFLVKECFGSFGQQVYMVRNREELEAKVKEIGTVPMLFQEFIGSSFGRDIRLQVVGSQVVASMYRYSDTGDFRANLSNGGRMKSYDSTEEQVELAIRCSKILGLDFAGVDLLFGENQEPIVCEVNSNAHFKNIFDCTGVNVADKIMEYIIKRLCIG